ncbi:gamma-glutamyltranspeptidase / glutathione hydrolase [Thermomonospora echinospora]|uniref:Gamma-glutamyltranspeptidase / glutathione hydrolase n=1 Tax=Thermomonospora echinospora TaxID=1992 RepID=A0A1H6DEA1_9ACTN|nr:gamma-glutamyltransferase family protein [Thermomonospora echinospora]SEG83580.1 gamma-glutamyltranspeptidase / glutathione hydrolase [Thermomonospora echinospora]
MLFRPELHGTRDAVASTHWLASAAGTAMFEHGGNAFDAAVAAAFVIQVVEPHLNGPGGDVPILVHSARDRRVEVICGQGPMPRAATVTAFRDLGLDFVPGSGLLAACVPGAFGAWMRLLQRHGRLRPAEVLAPAIGYADDGYPLLPKAAAMIEAMAPLFREEWAESGRTYLRNGSAPAPGDRVRNPVLADTFRRIVAEAQAAGPDRDAQIEGALRAFYEGFVAEAVDAFSTRAEMIDATGRHHRGLLTGDDLAAWRPGIEEPVTFDYRGHLVHKPGPWSQGPVFLQQLALLEGFDLAAMGFGSADHVHTVVEAAKLAFADREAWYGDPEYAQVPLKGLLDTGYAAERRALIGDGAAAELRPGSPDGRPPRLPRITGPRAGRRAHGWLEQLDNGIPMVVRLTEANGDTCFVTAVDREGNMVAATPSGGWLKSSPVVPGLGFPLGTRGQMAWLDTEHNNALAPGKRPRTTLSPSLVLRDGRPYLAFGTPGGDQQDQWTLNAFIGHVDFGLSPQQAVEAPAFHTDHVPSSFTPYGRRPRVLVMERGGWDEAEVRRLRDRGHEVEFAEPYSLGKVCATGLAPDGSVLAAASPRGAQAYAVAR